MPMLRDIGSDLVVRHLDLLNHQCRVGMGLAKKLEKGNFYMKIAIPLAAGKLSAHFGHCEQFALIEVKDNQIVGKELLTPPPHEPGVLPAWLAEQQVTQIIAGGMGIRAQQLFANNGIEVIVGAAADTPESIVESFLAGDLETGSNLCDH